MNFSDNKSVEYFKKSEVNLNNLKSSVVFANSFELYYSIIKLLLQYLQRKFYCFYFKFLLL